jgi:hypothetical protein
MQEKLVMPGPAEGRVPGIHDFRRTEKLVDARNKSAHDDFKEFFTDTFTTRFPQPDSRGTNPRMTTLKSFSPTLSQPASRNRTAV